MNKEHTPTDTLPSLEALYDASFARIYQRIYHLVRHREDAEDLTQEVFVRALRTLPTLKASHNLYGWPYRIASNLVLDLLRRRKLIAWHLLDTIEGTLEATEICDPQTCYERTAGQVFIALADLPEHYRCVLLLGTAGYSYTEIAALQGKTPHAMESFLLRARESFQQHYQTLEQQEEVSA